MTIPGHQDIMYPLLKIGVNEVVTYPIKRLDTDCFSDE